MLLYSNPAPVITTSKMCLFLLKLVIFSLIGARAGEMSPAPTPEFRQCFPQWVNASQVQVICNNTLIAQHCDPDDGCRNMNNSGVSLEKDREGVCLTITNCSYDSWSCEALGYIDSVKHKGNVTVNVTCNLPTSTSPSPGPISTSTSSGSNSTSTTPEPTADEVPVLIVIIIVLIIIIIVPIIKPIIIIILLIIIIVTTIVSCIYYNKQVKRFWKDICDICRRTPREQQDIELEERNNFL